MFLDIGLRPTVIGQGRGQPRPGPANPIAAQVFRNAAAQRLLRAVIKIAEQAAFPSVPDIGTDGANVDHGEDQQKPQPLRRLHEADKIPNGFRIVQIALEGRAAHGKMLQNQPGDHFRLPLAQPQARTELQGCFRAENRVIPATALGDIVEQHGDVKRPAGLRFRDLAAGDGMKLLEIALFDFVEHADGANGMLVHGIDMIHVILHLGDDASEIRHETSEHARLVEHAKPPFRVFGVGEDFQESSLARAFLLMAALTNCRLDVTRRNASG